ncbi:MAG: glycosyltransferase family 2 protein [Candidatus Thorarchaeota archaeon]
MYAGKRVCVVIPAWNEEEPIADTIHDFRTPQVDDVIVIDNNSTDNTAKVAHAAGATVIPEPIQGYGAAIRRGLREALDRGYDLIIITEADQTFRGIDVPRLLNAIRTHHFVVGTRTATPYLEEGANMGLFLVVGNIAVAKLLGLLHGYPPLTDVGCTLRVIRREMLAAILPKLDAEGAAFSPQMIVKVLKHGGKIKELPVFYLARVGEAKITTSKGKAFKNGLQMIKVILDL